MGHAPAGLRCLPAPRRHRPASDHGGSLGGFRLRLAASILATCVLLSATGYVLLSRQVERHVLDGHRLENDSAAAALAVTAHRAEDGEHPLDEMAELVAALSERPGVRGLQPRRRPGSRARRRRCAARGHA